MCFVHSPVCLHLQLNSPITELTNQRLHQLIAGLLLKTYTDPGFNDLTFFSYARLQLCNSIGPLLFYFDPKKAPAVRKRRIWTGAFTDEQVTHSCP